VGARWRQLFGDFNRLGISFEWHELAGGREVDWAQSFHPDSVELCLNLAGLAEVQAGDTAASFTAGTAGFYRRGRSPLSARRLAGPDHQFITVEYSPAFLEKHLGTGVEDVHPLVRSACSGGKMGLSSAAPVEPLSARQRELVVSLRQPPVLASAQSLWFQAKAVELMGEFFFQPPPQNELFCHRHQRVARDRIEQVTAILKRDLVNPPTLQDIGREVGCSPFYLSRTFSKEKGQTIPQFIRQIRLERAAALLRLGEHNVTEVALEVGYSSLSHFSQAFHQLFGCCPGLYPMATSSQKIKAPRASA
jgi:AraC-like DNA-binding protein